MVSLATAIERLGHVDFAKIDCEGSEWDLFEEEDPSREMGEVAVEYHCRAELDGRAAVDRLRELGFDPWCFSRGPGRTTA